MSINATKTEVMAVCQQGRVSKTTTAEAKKVCKHVCKDAGCRCNWTFYNKHGLRCHEGKCRSKDYFLVDKILAVRGETGSKKREFLIGWKGTDGR